MQWKQGVFWSGEPWEGAVKTGCNLTYIINYAGKRFQKGCLHKMGLGWDLGSFLKMVHVILVVTSHFPGWRGEPNSEVFIFLGAGIIL